jgi:hypothetical protein
MVVVYFDDNADTFKNANLYVKENNVKVFNYGWVLNPSNQPTCHRLKIEHEKQ